MFLSLSFLFISCDGYVKPKDYLDKMMMYMETISLY